MVTNSPSVERVAGSNRPSFQLRRRVADVHRGESVAVGGLSALEAQDSGDHVIGIMAGQAAHELDGVFVGSDRRVARLGAIDVDLG